MNNIVNMNLFPGWTKQVTRYPSYKVTYTLTDAEVIMSSTEVSNNGK